MDQKAQELGEVWIVNGCNTRSKGNQLCKAVCNEIIKQCTSPGFQIHDYTNDDDWGDDKATVPLAMIVLLEHAMNAELNTAFINMRLTACDDDYSDIPKVIIRYTRESTLVEEPALLVNMLTTWKKDHGVLWCGDLHFTGDDAHDPVFAKLDRANDDPPTDIIKLNPDNSETNKALLQRLRSDLLQLTKQQNTLQLSAPVNNSGLDTKEIVADLEYIKQKLDSDKDNNVSGDLAYIKQRLDQDKDIRVMDPTKPMLIIPQEIAQLFGVTEDMIIPDEYTIWNKDLAAVIALGDRQERVVSDPDLRMEILLSTISMTTRSTEPSTVGEDVLAKHVYKFMHQFGPIQGCIERCRSLWIPKLAVNKTSVALRTWCQSFNIDEAYVDAWKFQNGSLKIINNTQPQLKQLFILTLIPKDKMKQYSVYRTEDGNYHINRSTIEDTYNKEHTADGSELLEKLDEKERDKYPTLEKLVAADTVYHARRRNPDKEWWRLENGAAADVFTNQQFQTYGITEEERKLRCQSILANVQARNIRAFIAFMKAQSL